ncbi:MAG TPA: hypothetical protein VGK21_19030 [Candidatus Angelobacter sp.]
MKEPPVYDQALVTYIDILGFKDLVWASVEDSTKVSEIRNTLRMIAKKGSGLSYSETTLDGKVKLNVRTSNFSDLVVRATFLYGVTFDRLSEQLYYESGMLAAMECELTAKHGILIRGAISFGDLYMDSQTVFGPALVDSYFLSEKSAIYPRIIVDPRIMKVVADRASNFDELNKLWCIRPDDDGVFTIDYLQAAYAEYTEDSSSFQFIYGFKSFDAMMSDHARTIKSKLQGIQGIKDNARVRQKLVWLGRYHNLVVSDLKDEGCFNDGYERLLISEESLEIKQK